ncbi:uncharacterized protein LOC113211805 isoform X2 [Frankliniella occidentalis]|uniref:Uncharacterized protein LOC113211805 isoform X2 n=1 Tax=Frankliniella occidentalis TaxID=133901 RepID=A0A9C6WRN4_FRAOC|nr:uncharacterized protein LOC113211805 isoform X2 [Frankliniella occidentalis]
MMELLPDDLLLKVMQYLDVPDLFACRLVCKRLGALAFDRDAWRHRKLETSFHDGLFPWVAGLHAPRAPAMPCVCPVLRLAPCLRELGLDLPPQRCRLAYTSTRCAVEELRLSICMGHRPDSSSGVSSAYQAAAVLSRQESLGRLRRLRFDLNPGTDAPAFIATMASTPGLEELRVLEICAPDWSNPVMGCTVLESSLRLFQYTLSNTVSEQFANFILSGHAATLEVVDLGKSPSEVTFKSTASLLAGVLNLRELTCCTIPGLEVLADCETLRVLNLVVGTKRQHKSAGASAAKLLRGAKHLREVELQYKPLASKDSNVGVDLVMALAQGKSCGRVEKLSIVNTLDEDEDDYDFDLDGVEKPLPQLKALICALPSLSGMRHLRIVADMNPEKLLSAISPATAPSLEIVELPLPRLACAHAFIHGSEVKTVLAANPLLHIKLCNPICYCKQKECQPCKTPKCHKQLRDVEYGSTLVLFSHDPSDKCSRAHSPTKYNLWIHIPL